MMKFKDMNELGRAIYLLVISILVFLVLSLILTLFTELRLLPSLRIAFGSLYVLFLPGFIISYIFFPKTKRFDEKENTNQRKESIDWIERIALSFALSIAIVPLAVFYLNLIGVKISFLNSFLTILAIIVISLGILVYKKRGKKG